MIVVYLAVGVGVVVSATAIFLGGRYLSVSELTGTPGRAMYLRYRQRLLGSAGIAVCFAVLGLTSWLAGTEAWWVQLVVVAVWGLQAVAEWRKRPARPVSLVKRR